MRDIKASLIRSACLMAVPLIPGMLVCQFVQAPPSHRPVVRAGDRQSMAAGYLLEQMGLLDKVVEFDRRPLSADGAEAPEVLVRENVDLTWATLDQLPILSTKGYKAILLLGSSWKLDYLLMKLPHVGDIQSKRISFPEYGPGRWILANILGPERWTKWPGRWQAGASRDRVAEQFDTDNTLSGAVLWGGGSDDFSRRAYSPYQNGVRVQITDILVAKEAIANSRNPDVVQLIDELVKPFNGSKAVSSIQGSKAYEKSGDKKQLALADLQDYRFAGRTENEQFFTAGSPMNIAAEEDFARAETFWKLQGRETTGKLADAISPHYILKSPPPAVCGTPPSTWHPRIFFRNQEVKPEQWVAQEFERDLGHYLKSVTPDQTLCVDGHANDTGPSDANQKYSDDRMDWLKTRLAALRPLNSIRGQGHGPSRPIDPKDPGSPRNRRAEVYVAQ